jgi:hypothetical protein
LVVEVFDQRLETGYFYLYGFYGGVFMVHVFNCSAFAAPLSVSPDREKGTPRF